MNIYGVFIPNLYWVYIIRINHIFSTTNDIPTKNTFNSIFYIPIKRNIHSSNNHTID